MNDERPGEQGRVPIMPGFREMALRRMSAERRRLVADLTAQRRSAGLSQTEVAARMGTSQSAVARLETGDADVRVSTLERYAAAIGRQVVGGLALRPDRLERLVAAARTRARAGPFNADAEMAALGGIPPEALRQILLALGYRAVIAGDREVFVAKPRRKTPEGRKRGSAAASNADSPFAKLKEVRFA